jgi:hypothetical protein
LVEDPQRHTLGLQLLADSHKVRNAAGQPVELRDDKHITIAQLSARLRCAECGVCSLRQAVAIGGCAGQGCGPAKAIRRLSLRALRQRPRAVALRAGPSLRGSSFCGSLRLRAGNVRVGLELRQDKEVAMDTTTLLIIVLVLLLLFGGGWYGRGRWY